MYNTLKLSLLAKIHDSYRANMNIYYNKLYYIGHYKSNKWIVLSYENCMPRK